MTRVSLKEAYDNKDVVAQIYAIRDIAEGAEDTANGAVSTANTASEHVDALVPQVEGAVQNANNASASAQTSAQTVAGYENRLSNVELKITTAEGQIVTIQGRVTALETADGQNVKINSINQYAIGLTGNQNSTGTKQFEAIKTPFLEIMNNFRPVNYYGDYDPMNIQSGERVRVITVFASPNKKEQPVCRLETFDDATTIGLDLSSTVYDSGISRSITMRVRKSDGMSYVTVPSRDSANVSDYYSDEVVTINTLKKLRLIQ